MGKMHDHDGSYGSAADWLTQLTVVREQTAIVAGLDPFQACRVGFNHGGNLALDYVESLLARGASVEEALAYCRAYWRTTVLDWTEAATQPGQEVIPLIPADPSLLEQIQQRRPLHLVEPDAPDQSKE